MRNINNIYTIYMMLNPIKNVFVIYFICLMDLYLAEIRIFFFTFFFAHYPTKQCNAPRQRVSRQASKNANINN